MNNLDDSLGNVSRRFIFLSFFTALLIDLVPLPTKDFFWLPEISSMLLVFWLIHKPRTVGLGVAFLIGLLVDIGLNTPLGQHALAYSITSFFVIRQQARIAYYNVGTQSLVILGALLGNQAIMSLVRLFYDHKFIGWLPFLSAFIAALIWPIFNKLISSLVNFKRH